MVKLIFFEKIQSGNAFLGKIWYGGWSWQVLRSKLNVTVALTIESLSNQLLLEHFGLHFLDLVLKLIMNSSCWNIKSCGASVGQVVKFFQFKPLAPHCYGFDFYQGLWILSCEEVIQPAYKMSVVLLWCQFVPEILVIFGGAP
jgi:hypothetical protein